MIVVPTAPLAHYGFDALAWAGATLAGWAQHRLWPGASQRLQRVGAPGYFIALALGGVIGAWLAGSLNTLPVGLAPSHSIAGALAGAIAGVELWKWRHGVRGSTGGAFVVPIAVGIMIGRWGCLFAGLPDQTYGSATSLPWAVDLGDGVGRHPVEIYESLAMAAFLARYVPARARGRRWAVAHGFHAFVLWYALQRFAWEFCKPYPRLIGPFNLFHLICGGLAIYASVWWWRDRAQERAVPVPWTDDEPVRDLP